jgi:hypothetical protein
VKYWDEFTNVRSGTTALQTLQKYAEGVGVSALARTTGLTRKTDYRVLAGFGFRPRRWPRTG